MLNKSWDRVTQSPYLSGSPFPSFFQAILLTKCIYYATQQRSDKAGAFDLLDGDTLHILGTACIDISLGVLDGCKRIVVPVFLKVGKQHREPQERGLGGCGGYEAFQIWPSGWYREGNTLWERNASSHIIRTALRIERCLDQFSLRNCGKAETGTYLRKEGLY